MNFGVAYEGVTDYIVIKNILCGYFPKTNIKIRPLQPELDETDEKQNEDGGWENLLKYLKSMYFFDTLENESVGFVIIQIDSDDSQHPNFGVSHYGEENKILSVESLIENIKEKLIDTINSVELNLYDDYSQKIIFAISVGSLECWLYNYYRFIDLQKKKKIFKSSKNDDGCGKGLNHLLKEEGFIRQGNKPKDKELYKKYSKDFLTKKNIEIAAEKDPSLKVFIQQLQPISL